MDGHLVSFSGSTAGANMPIACPSFEKVVSKKLLYVDKSLFIKEFWDGGDVCLILRPRRFGKTLNLTLLKSFFNIGADKSIFENLEINQKYPKFVKEHCGKYPVIHFTFSGYSNINSLASFMDELKGKISTFLDNYNLSLEQIEMLSPTLKKTYYAFLDKKATIEEYHDALSKISEILYRIYGNDVIILIDEYDTPIIYGSMRGFGEEIAGFMSTFYVQGLKNNSRANKSCLMGIVHLRGMDAFSGLNFMSVSSYLTEDDFSDKFGFTSDEIDDVISKLYETLTEDRKQGVSKEDIVNLAKKYYNGYMFGGQLVVNPWSFCHWMKQVFLSKVSRFNTIITVWSSSLADFFLEYMLKVDKDYILEFLIMTTTKDANGSRYYHVVDLTSESHQIFVEDITSRSITYHGLIDLFITTGFLTYEPIEGETGGKVYIPNFELERFWNI